MAPYNMELENRALEISKQYNADKDNKIDQVVCYLYQLNEIETAYILNQ